MRMSIYALLLATVTAAACAPEEDDGELPPMYTVDAGPTVAVDSGLPPVVDASSLPLQPVVDSSVIPPKADTGAVTPGADTGVVVPVGDASTADAVVSTPDTGVSTGGPEPVIPAAPANCPAFKSGSMNLFGLTVDVTAGAKSSGAKGPLVFYWHGTGGNGSEAQRSLPAAVRKEITDMGGIIVAPNNTTMKGDDVTFILGVWFTPGDFEWADQVAACAIKDYNIDPRRIYSTGCSAGGLASGVMAFQRSNYLAAAAPNSGGIAVPGQDKLQNPMRMTPTLTMHGKKGSDVVIVDFADTSNTHYTSGKAKGGFMIDCDHGGGHCAAPPELQTAAWQFMKDHPFGVSPEPYANGLPASFPKYCVVK